MALEVPLPQWDILNGMREMVAFSLCSADTTSVPAVKALEPNLGLLGVLQKEWICSGLLTNPAGTWVNI